MILYVPTSGLNTCERLTTALWGLARPAHLRTAEDTQMMFGYITCTDNSVWMAVDTEFTIPVHPEAELDGIADVLQPWIDEGALPPNTNTDLAALIESLRGQSLTVWDAFPMLFKTQARTVAQLIAAGLLPTIA